MVNVSKTQASPTSSKELRGLYAEGRTGADKPGVRLPSGVVKGLARGSLDRLHLIPCGSSWRRKRHRSVSGSRTACDDPFHDRTPKRRYGAFLHGR